MPVVLVGPNFTAKVARSLSAQDHTELVDAFYRIAQDRANKIVIPTGAGGDFITGVEWSLLGNVATPAFGARFTTRACRAWKTQLACIRVPVIAAIEGRAHVHSEYALLANVIVAAEGRDLPRWSALRRRELCRGTGFSPPGAIDAGAGRAEAIPAQSAATASARTA